ncbi:MAG: YbaB/EbfC family nucleoid-associated protein [Parachlamydiaceae bacterium]
MGTGFSKRKKEAKALQAQLSKMQADMESAEVVGASSQDLVTITMTGDYTVKQVKIKPECVDPEDTEGLQDLVKAAFMDAKKKLDSQSSTAMKGLPGMPNLPFQI